MIDSTRRKLLLAGASVAALACRPALAQSSFPDRPLRIIVPYEPGGSLDFVARVVAAKLDDAFGQRVVVDNMSGAGSMIGTDFVAHAPADGYTALLSGGTITMQPFFVKHLGYDVNRDFVPISLLVTYGLTLDVSTKLPVTTLEQFVAYAKQPGHQIFFGSPGVGTTPHLAGEFFNSVTGLHMTHVPYKGNGPMMAALISGEVQVGFDTIVNSKPQMDAGKVRILALTGDKRSKLMPQIPTAAQAGLPDFVLNMWQGLFLPKKTPPAIVAKWNAAVRQALADPGVQAKFQNAAFDVTPSSPAQMQTVIDAELVRWGKIAKFAGITPQ